MKLKQMKNLASLERRGLAEKVEKEGSQAINAENFELVKTRTGHYFALGTERPFEQILFDGSFKEVGQWR